MTVRLETKIHRYIGLSGDSKPVPGQPDPAAPSRVLTGADVPVGSTFLEADTEDLYRWNGREWTAEDNKTVTELKAIKGLLGELLEQGTTGL